MERVEVFEKLKEVLVMVNPKLDLAKITEETRLKEDLGLDSLTMMLLAMATETKFDIKFDSGLELKNVKDVCDHVICKSAK